MPLSEWPTSDGSHWKTLPSSGCNEYLGDGWWRYTGANAKTGWSQQYSFELDPRLKPSTLYTLLVEIRNVERGGTLRFTPNYSQGQFLQEPYFVVTGDAVLHVPVTTVDDFEGAGKGLDFRGNAQGDYTKTTYELRLSLYEGEYELGYKPYVLGYDDVLAIISSASS